MKDGVYYDLPFDEYLAAPGLSSSFLRHMDRSPAYAKYRESIPDGRTDSMVLGSALHCALLEPSKYRERYIELPKLDRRTAAGKAAYSEAVAKAPNATLLSLEQSAAVQGMCAAVHRHPTLIGMLGAQGNNEISIFWTRDGIQCKARIDRRGKYLNGGAFGVDLKTTTDARPHQFLQSVTKYGYHLQQVWYLEALKAAHLEVNAFMFAAIESDAPYGVMVHQFDDGLIYAGYQDMDRLFVQYKECIKTDSWPGYDQEVNQLLCPDWMLAEEDESNEWTES